MTKSQLLELHKLPTEEKIKIVQDLWDDIAHEKSLDMMPEEHKRILDERIEKINSGKAVFKPWSEVQAKYKRGK
jgi:putative addiction module component (TIGR02574 family)